MYKSQQAALSRPTNLGELFRCYQVSPEARSAAYRTKIQRAYAFDAAIKRFHGTLSLAEIEKRDFRVLLYNWRDSFVTNPASGRQYIQAINTVFNWAVDRGYMRDNPALGMKKFPSASRAHIIWTPSDIEAFHRAATEPVRRVFDIALWTGLRVNDVLNLCSHNVDEGWITVSPEKNRRQGLRLHLPYCELPILGATMVRILATNWLPHVPLLRTASGIRWTYGNFRKQFLETMVRAGLDETQLHFHDLRGTLITRLHEASCTQAEVGAISGHGLATGNMRGYVARTRPLAVAAYRKLAAAYPL